MRPRRDINSVPGTGRVVPGAVVHIVFKQDQPTGRTVQGTVQTVLTRGNHPRGIKVRLSDGRVGRVQAISDGTASTAHSTGNSSSLTHRSSSSFGEGAIGSSGDELPRAQLGLDAYIVPARPKQQQKRYGVAEGQDDGMPAERTAEQSGRASPSAPSAICPVCGVFQGDEAAVSHHVATHFETDA